MHKELSSAEYSGQRRASSANVLATAPQVRSQLRLSDYRVYNAAFKGKAGHQLY